jgi:selenide,water dikinase
VPRLIEEKKVPGGSIANYKSFDPYVKWREDITEGEKFLLNDAQTSGGLLIFVPGDKKEKLITALQKENILAVYIGDVFSEEIKDNKRIFVD